MHWLGRWSAAIVWSCGEVSFTWSCRRSRTWTSSLPGVGNRLAELVVTALDRPQRFRNGREVGAYAGLVPRQYESGMMSRMGRITRQGPGLLRRLLVQIAWGMERRCQRVADLFKRLSGGQKSGRKKAAVAIARKILVWCWGMLRDGTTWRELPASPG